MAQQKVVIPIPVDYGPDERDAIGQEIIDRIIERTRNEQKDRFGENFPAYSKSYEKEKGSSTVDLTMTGAMLDELQVLSHRRGEVVIGYDASSELNGRAEGNIKGSYGGSDNPSRARDFLGIEDTDLEAILGRFDVNTQSSVEQARAISVASSFARDIASNSTVSLSELLGEEDG